MTPWEIIGWVILCWLVVIFVGLSVGICAARVGFFKDEAPPAKKPRHLKSIK